MKLGEIAIGNNLTGVEPTLVVTVVAVRPIAEGAVEVIYKTPVPAFILDSIHDSAMFI